MSLRYKNALKISTFQHITRKGGGIGLSGESGHVQEKE